MFEYSNKVLTISGSYKPVMGGIKAVVNSYNLHIFKPFFFVPNSLGKTSVGNVVIRIICPFRMVFQFVVHPSIKIVHIHTGSYKPFFYSTIVAKVARLFKKKVIFHMHGGGFRDYYLSNKTFVSKELLKADAIIALSNYWYEFYHNEIGHPNVHIISNIVEPPIILDYKKKDDTLNFLFLGFIQTAKGIFDLVELLKSYHNEYKGKLHLYIGGARFEEERLREYIKENKLNDIITMCGWVTGNKKIELINQSDVYILPSYKEGSPISIIECMTYGLPIVATNVGGIPEMIEDGKNGLLFEPGKKEAMKHSIDTLLNNPSLRELMGKNAKEASLKYFPKNVKKELSNLYESLLLHQNNC